ncbi:protein defective in meristem silencing 3 [Phtheirospermum japonicum]|uniref:Protein defective in meristem silencing 3 n=1 Tax=Phtheirospermum japonicum TaxID=374723 RepID=A0A830C7L2_9LAMI|nr:protein defective in meristem silencing 3 [Phtheirospermum japonicum]
MTRLKLCCSNCFQKLQDDLHEIGQRIKHHEDNVKYLNASRNKSEESIVNMQAALEKYDKVNLSAILNKDAANVKSEDETVGHILKHDKSAAALLCMMKNQAKTLSSEHSLTKDMVGIVATLGKVDDANLSRLLAEYLGLEKMLAVVCKTYDGVKALEAYNREGLIDKNLGVHAFAATIGRPLTGRFLVICLEDIRPYAGEFIADDPQKRLALRKPRLPNGETPIGFLGFAVNMITIDKANLYCVTKNGHGLRETVFYNLLSNLQVYRTRDDMMKALPYIRNGAVSLDGGITRKPGVLCLGRRDIGVKFPNGSESLIISKIYIEIKHEMKEMQWKKDRTSGDIEREQILLDHAKLNYEMKKQEFLQFLAESSSSHVPRVMHQNHFIIPKK